MVLVARLQGRKARGPEDQRVVAWRMYIWMLAEYGSSPFVCIRGNRTGYHNECNAQGDAGQRFTARAPGRSVYSTFPGLRSWLTADWLTGQWPKGVLLPIGTPEDQCRSGPTREIIGRRGAVWCLFDRPDRNWTRASRAYCSAKAQIKVVLLPQTCGYEMMSVCCRLTRINAPC